MKNLKEILTIPRFTDLVVLNTQANLDVPLHTVEISETPDVANYLSPHSLLLTTGMAYRDSPDDLCELIAHLNSLPSAGLAVKIGRYIPKISKKVIDFADSLNFPIIQIPMNMTLGDISHKLLSYLWSDQTEEIFFSLEIQQKFAELLFKGASTSVLIDQLSHMIKQPIMLIDPFGHLATSSRNHTVEEFLTPAKKKELLAQLTAKQQEAKKESFLFKIDEGEHTLVNLIPINSDSYIPYLLVLFKVDQLAYPFSQFAIEQSLIVLALSIYKEQTIKYENRSVKLHLFHNLLHSEKNGPSMDFVKQYPIIDSLDSNYYRVVVVSIQVPKNKSFYEKEIDLFIYDFLEEYLTKTNSNLLLLPTDEDNQFVLLFKDKKDLQSTLEELYDKTFKLLTISLSFGVGDPVNQLSLFHFSYKEAKSSLENSPSKKNFVFYNTIQGINRIAENVSEEEMQHFCQSILKSLAYPTNQTNQELRKTLTTYLDCQCKISETADQLFVHRNTVKYRIEKCNQLFGQSVDDSKLSLKLRVALSLSENESADKNS
ncbi:PucR family transcriptional regulator [Candidatus Enterococcus ikei]|uniref:PucR family transcriptional regulator ligand-binding domain-containing protein n=1 Tax=Candidatus Enterococcus ikei TaxID=2815326 RepID=A0ABS3GVP7_9ENTE|nr:PucR family transcriptional regulator [Enterococcus sp. DIV0869a]MBO0439332.1 PucR family transcriptional regulator ligand-binding domain-containing protein [Enterococcus sp. DIV0869a]